jgi:hypothetical protein
MEAQGGRDWWAYNRDLIGRSGDPWARRAGLSVLFVLSAAALLNVFGQRVDNSSVTASAASLSLNAPSKARGGDIFQARLEVHARREVREPLLILEPGWLDGLTKNTTAPEAKEERTDNGRVVLAYDAIPAGRKLTVWLQYQVNPTHAGKTDEDVELWDGDQRLARLEHTLTVFP